MFKLIFKTVFFWRRNDASSIVFKTLFFGALGYLMVIPFTDVRNAGIAGAVAAVLAFAKYALQHHREHARMLAYVGGDKEKLKALKGKLATSGAANAFMMEMVRAEMEEASDGHDDEETTELNDAQREENRLASEANLERILAAVTAQQDLDVVDQEERVAELRETFAEGDEVYDARTILATLLAERELSFGYEDYCNEDDHASLVETVAEATHGAWTPSECVSTFDEASDKYTVRFKDNGEEQVWRFNQSGDWLSNNFLCKLFGYAEDQSGQKVVTLDSEDYFEGIILPLEFYEQLSGEGLLKAAS